MIVGYARVSTDGQTLDAPQSALTAAGAEKVFAEKVSGAVTDRKALAKAILALGPSDVLPVTRLDRLALSIITTKPSPITRPTLPIHLSPSASSRSCEKDRVAVGIERAKVVLLVRVVGLAKVVVHRDGLDDAFEQCLPPVSSFWRAFLTCEHPLASMRVAWSSWPSHYLSVGKIHHVFAA